MGVTISLLSPIRQPKKNPTSKIQRSRRYLSEWDAHFCETEIASLPYNSELWQILSTGERCSPLQIVLERFFCRKIATLGACPHLCSALPIPHSSLLTPHSSFLISHSSLLTPHSSFLTPHSSLLIPHFSFLTPHSSLLTPHSSLNTAPPLHSPPL